LKSSYQSKTSAKKITNVTGPTALRGSIDEIEGIRESMAMKMK